MGGFDAEAVRRFEHAGWQRVAACYGSRFAAATTQFISILLDAASIGPLTKVLDVACGPGYAAVGAALRGGCATGLDFSSAMIAIARAENPEVTFIEGDAEALPFNDASFDAVVANFGIHHVPRPGIALAEAHRVLRPGGRLALTTWAEPASNIAWKLVLEAIVRYGDLAASDAPPPQGGFNQPDDCLNALEKAGFLKRTTLAWIERHVWRVASAEHLLEALEQGTVRMGGLITAQRSRTRAKILFDIESRMRPFKAGHVFEVPIAGIVAKATKI